MAQLTKERDHLFETIRTYRLLFETTRQLINEMQGTVPVRLGCQLKVAGVCRFAVHVADEMIVLC